MLKSDILYTAAENLEKLTGLKINAELITSPLWDGTLSIRKNGYSDTLQVEIKKEVHQSNLIDLLPQLKNSGLLVATYISKPGKKLLEDHHINYLDIAGNCRIETPSGIFFHIKGEKARHSEIVNKHRSFNKNGIKLIYALLLDKKLVNEPYRVMADMANISLGTVGDILRDLQENRFLIKVRKGERALHNKKELLHLWVTAFNQILKPKLLRNRYRLDSRYEGNSWKELKLGDHAFWGGEPAADLYTNFLHPGIWTIYTDYSRQQLIQDLQLVPDPNHGNVEVYGIFWNIEDDLFVDQQEKAVSPLLTYAELLGTGESRNLEVAKRIYEKYLKDIVE